MNSTITKWIFVGILSAILSGGVLYMVYDYYHLIGEKAAWQGKYDQIKQAQAESEAEVARLRERSAELDKSLEEWRTTLETIRKQTAATSQSIRSLENANKEVRDILRLVVPADLRGLLFPPAPGYNSSDQNGTRTVPPALGTGIQ